MPDFNIRIILEDRQYLGRESSAGISIEHRTFVVLRWPAGPVGTRVPEEVDSAIAEHPRYQ